MILLCHFAAAKEEKKRLFLKIHTQKILYLLWKTYFRIYFMHSGNSIPEIEFWKSFFINYVSKIPV